MDRDTIIVRYDTPFALMADLKGMGERAAFAKGATSPMSRRILMQAVELYQARHSDPDGRIRATFEIVHLSGWGPAPTQPKPLRPGSARASLAEAVRRQGKQ